MRCAGARRDDGTVPPIPTPHRSCGADCAVRHSTVLPPAGDRRQHVQHVWVDDVAAGLMTTWQRHTDGAWWAYVYWSCGDGSMYQGWIPARRITELPDHAVATPR